MRLRRSPARDALWIALTLAQTLAVAAGEGSVEARALLRVDTVGAEILARNEAAVVTAVSCLISPSSFECVRGRVRRFQAFSADGRFIALGQPGCSSSEVFLLDLATGVRTLVSADDVTGDCGGGFGPAVSANGDFVAFESGGCLVGQCFGFGTRIFLRNRPARRTECVSIAVSGQCGSSDFSMASNPAISADGTIVAFDSDARDLVAAGCTTGVRQVLVRDRVQGATTCASVASNGVPGTNSSAFPALSADGTVVAFESRARNLASGCTSGRTQIFVHDRSTGTTRCASLGPDGSEANQDSLAAEVSGDGMLVVFVSSATNLVASSCQDGRRHVFVHDRRTGTTRCVSVAPDGTAGNGDSGFPVISADGRMVTYQSRATNLVPATAVASRAAGPRQGEGDRQQIFSSSLVAERVNELRSADAEGNPGDGLSARPSTNATGSRVIYLSNAPDLGAPGSTALVLDREGAEQVPPVSVRTTILAPANGSQFLLDGTAGVSFTWESLGTPRYFFEFSGPGRSFANPNGTTTDPVNGAGGAGGGFYVSGPGFAATVGPSLAPGSYQVRVIGATASGALEGTFSDFVTVVLGISSDARVTITTPAEGTRLVPSAQVTFAWTPLPGITTYGFEFTGTDRRFANPNATGPDPENGFGGAGGGFAVSASSLTVTIPPAPAGTYQVRVIGLPGGQPVGRFSDAVTVVIGP